MGLKQLINRARGHYYLKTKRLKMVQLRPNLYIGSLTDGQDLATIQQNYITAVFNIAYELDDPIFSPLEIRYVKVGLMDNNQNRKYMKELAVETLVKLLQEGEIVLLHCAAGLSRASFISCKALSIVEQKDISEVFNELKLIKPMAMWGPLFEGEGYIPEGAANA